MSTVWISADGREYTLAELSDTHLQNIVIMTISSYSYKAWQLRREARRRQLFLRTGWQANKDIKHLAQQYIQGDEVARLVLADLLEEEGHPLHYWIRNSPMAWELTQCLLNWRSFGETK